MEKEKNSDTAVNYQEFLTSIFPDADPDFLELKASQFAAGTEDPDTWIAKATANPAAVLRSKRQVEEDELDFVFNYNHEDYFDCYSSDDDQYEDFYFVEKSDIDQEPNLSRGFKINNRNNESSLNEDKETTLKYLKSIFPDEATDFLISKIDEYSGDKTGLQFWIDSMLMPRNPEKKPRLNLNDESDQERNLKYLQDIFPNENVGYLEAKLAEFGGNQKNLQKWIDSVLEPKNAEEKPNLDLNGKSENDQDPNLQYLMEIFPKEEMMYLKRKSSEFGGDEQELQKWIDSEIGKKDQATGSDENHFDLPSASARSIPFDIETFLKMCHHDPESHYMNTDRSVSERYKSQTSQQLQLDFPQTDEFVIQEVVKSKSGLYIPSLRALQNVLESSQDHKLTDDCLDSSSKPEEDFLQEFQYSRFAQEVLYHLYTSNTSRELDEPSNLSIECGCCYDEAPVQDMLECDAGHPFCKNCVRHAAELAIGDGKTSLICLAGCPEQFSVVTLQKALDAKTFEKWIPKIQIAEVEKAGIDNLEHCPFCNFASIIDIDPEILKIFHCQNPTCLKKSCRKCKKDAHPNIECEDEKATNSRTFIENKMSEALIRNCLKCKAPYIKLEGCNRIQCDKCKAEMCYVCRKPITGYSHFHEKRCPLWSKPEELHKENVDEGEKEAKREQKRQARQLQKQYYSNNDDN